VREQDLGHGNKIIGFDDVEEILAYQQQMEAEANAQPLLPEQETITWGSDVLRIVDGPLMIYGHIYTIEEFLEVEAQAGASSDEIVFEMDQLKDAHQRNYRYGMWYSEICPEGEPGDAHLVSLWPITGDDFRAAEEQGWNFSTSLAQRVYGEVDASREQNRD